MSASLKYDFGDVVRAKQLYTNANNNSTGKLSYRTAYCAIYVSAIGLGFEADYSKKRTGPLPSRLTLDPFGIPKYKLQTRERNDLLVPFVNLIIYLCKLY